MSSKRSFLDTVYILYILGKCFGLSCYSITRSRIKYKVSFGMFDCFYFIAFVGLLLILTYLNLRLEMNNDENNTRIFNIAQHILIILSLVFLVGGVTGVLLMRHRFWNIADTLNNIDNQMMQLLKIRIDHNSLYRYTLIQSSICYSTLVVVYTLLGYYAFVINKTEGMIAQYFSYVIICGTFALLTIQFQVFLYSVYKRFSALIGFFEWNIIPKTQLKLSWPTSLKLQANVLSIAKITDQLNNLVPILCLYFFTFTVTSTIGLFCVTVFNSHNFFRAMNVEKSFAFYLLLVIYEIIGVLYGFLTCLTVAISSNNTYAAKRMGVLAHKAIARTRNQQFISKLKVLSMQILHRSPNVSFGLFSMNWQFLFSFVASAASYLFILVQFQGHVDEK